LVLGMSPAERGRSFGAGVCARRRRNQFTTRQV
jgi:hypothetical protein